MNWKMTIFTSLIVLFFSCQKKDIPQISELKKQESYYFDLRSNPKAEIPKFETGDEALKFLLSNFKRVDSMGNPYNNSPDISYAAQSERDQTSKLKSNGGLMNTNTMDVDEGYSEETTTFGGAGAGMVSGFNFHELPESSFDFYNASYFDFCPIWASDYLRKAIHMQETINGYYTARGIICVLGFYIKYAPAAVSPGQQSGKMIYGPGGANPYLTITGGALGEMEPATIQFTMNSSGSGNINAHQVEKRTMIFTSQDKWVFKAGTQNLYTVGTEIEAGVTIKQALNSVTSYTLAYALQFYDLNNVSHTHSANGCDFSVGLPMMAFQDIGSVIVGVPRN